MQNPPQLHIFNLLGHFASAIGGHSVASKWWQPVMHWCSHIPHSGTAKREWMVRLSQAAK